MEFDEIKVKRLLSAFEVLSDYCVKRTDCTHCPFEKVHNDGSGTCKFRYATGLPAYMLGELITGPVIKDDTNDI